MAPRGKKNDDWGGYGSKQAYVDAIKSGKVKTETMAGGNLRSTLVAAASRLATPARAAVRDIGLWAAESSGEAGSFVAKTGRTVGTKGEVFTPEGVFKGKDVFIKKADLTANQIAGIEKGMATRAANQLAREVNTVKRAAPIIAGVASVGTLAAQEGLRQAQNVVHSVEHLVNRLRGKGKKTK